MHTSLWTKYIVIHGYRDVFFIYFTAVSYTFDVKVENKIQIVITWNLIIASAILDSN